MLENGSEVKLMENVVLLQPEGDGIYLQDILGENATVKGRIKEIRLLDHKIILSEKE
jgi:predicted RNA-binding protein